MKRAILFGASAVIILALNPKLLQEVSSYTVNQHMYMYCFFHEFLHTPVMNMHMYVYVLFFSLAVCTAQVISTVDSDSQPWLPMQSGYVCTSFFILLTRVGVLCVTA